MGGLDYELELDIAAPPAAVREAVGTAAGVRQWWTRRVEGTDGLGGTMRLRFGETGWTDLRIDRLEPGEVEWTCTGQEIAQFEPSDEWVGTRISFAIRPGEEGTHLAFTHHGLAALGCIGICERGWSQHVGASLKGLLETGSGTPM